MKKLLKLQIIIFYLILKIYKILEQLKNNILILDINNKLVDKIIEKNYNPII
jgi:hypothetical protein